MSSIWAQEIPVNTIVGLTMADVSKTNDGEIMFITTDGRKFKMWGGHECDAGCHVNVEIDDICGDLKDLIGSPIVQADVADNDRNTILEMLETGHAKGKSDDESFTWTFYRITTMKGQVVLRWYGSSNGYYSERANFGEILDCRPKSP